MKKGPGLFSSFFKKSKESLTKDYLLDHKVSISTKRVPGVVLTSSAINKDGVSTVDIGAVYRSRNSTVGVKIDARSNIATTLTFMEIAPSTKAIASLHLPHFRTSKLKVQYFHHHATLTSTMAFNEARTIGISATIGTPTFAMGAKAAYGICTSKINFAFGINFNTPDSTVSLVMGDNGDTIRSLFRYRFDVSTKTAAAVEITRRLSANETEFVVGGCYAFDDQTSVKAKLDNWGKLGAVLLYKFIPKARVSLSSELNMKALQKIPKFGFAFVLKP